MTQPPTNRLTRPSGYRNVAWYGDELAKESTASATAQAAALPARVTENRGRIQARLGVWTDPWFGAVSVCEGEGAIRFTASKSPLLRGRLMRVGQRTLVDWDDDRVDAEAWLAFSGSGADAVMTMGKVDPDADFSFDYEDLAFRRSGSCPRQ